MLVACCLIHLSIIILWHILHLAYLVLCLGLGLFMSYFCDLFSIFIVIFIASDSITLKLTHLFIAHFLEYLLLFVNDNMDEESK